MLSEALGFFILYLTHNIHLSYSLSICLQIQGGKGNWLNEKCLNLNFIVVVGSVVTVGAAVIVFFFIVKVILITTLFSFYLIHYFLFLSLHLFYVRNLTFTPLLMHEFISNLYKQK